MPEAVNLGLTRATVPKGPYPGLRPFEPDEWSIFFGREVMAAEVIAKLGQQNLIIVHGASGCGKSSLVRAGVLPALQRDHDLNRQDFRYSIMRPSQGPLEALAAALLTQLGPVDPDDPEHSWFDRAAIDQDLVETIERRLADAEATFCLVVDQFEEIFRWAAERDLAEAEFLVDFLCKVARRHTGNRNFFVLVTMRSDYLGQCAQFPTFAAVVNQCQYLLDNLDEFGILRAIHEPADRFGGIVDPPLADRLRFMAKDDTDPLPILQHTLMCMYDALDDKARGWKLDLDSFATVSGEHGALHEHVERIYLETVGESSARAEQLEWMFRALTDLDAGGRAIRRPCRVTDLAAVSGADEAAVLELVDAFARPGRNFLVVAASARGSKEVDISHEALIRRWRRLGDSNVDPNTGLRSGWLYREFQAGLIWKALAVFAKRGEQSLEPGMAKQWLPFFEQVQRRPAWASRYFVDPLPGVAPSEQPEWKQVIALIRASKERLERDSRAWRRALTRYWSYLLIAAAVLVAGAVWKGYQLNDQAERAKAEAVAATAATVEALERTKASQQLERRSREDALRRAYAARMREIEAQTEVVEARRQMAEARRQLAAAERESAAAKVRAAAAITERNDRVAEMAAERRETETAIGDILEMFRSQQTEMIQAFEEYAQEFEDLEESLGVTPAVDLPTDFASGVASAIASLAGPGAETAEIASRIEELRAEYLLTTDRRLAAFLAVAAFDTNRFTSFEERLVFDSAEALWESFPTFGREAPLYVNRPEGLADILYGRNEEFGNTEPGDAWKYRGRGMIFARGRATYGGLGSALSVDLIDRPELLTNPNYMVRAALEQWQHREGNRRADAGNIYSIWREIAGVRSGQGRIVDLERQARAAIRTALAHPADDD